MKRLLAAAFLAAACASAQVLPSAPEGASGWTPKELARSRHDMVAAAHPLAVDAGVRMLERGGSAVDAMIAAQLVLGLVEPSSSGLGGGAFLLHYDAKSRTIAALDGRETAPAGANSSLFLRPDGRPMSFSEARFGGRSVGVPGVPRILEVAHVRFGRLPWKVLFEPAIDLAERGFILTPRQATLAGANARLRDLPGAEGYLHGKDGKPLPAGTRVRNPRYAATLRQLAGEGMDAFYEGTIAREIVEAVRSQPNAGTLAMEDLAAYRVRDVDALCACYRGHRVCGMPPSSSAGIAVLQILGLLAPRDLGAMRPMSAEAIHTITEAERLAFADRNRYVADERFVDVPVRGLLDAGYLASRGRLIRNDRSMGRAEPGVPVGAIAFADDRVEEAAGTSHVSIVDRDGNAVAFTTSVESAFGSQVMAAGFFLNNTLTDFNFLPSEGTHDVANRVAPGKRPRSSMSPLLVFDDRTGALEMILGSPGGSFIIEFVTKVLVGVIDWHLDLQSAIDLPNFGSRNGPTDLEKATALEGLDGALNAMGHEVQFLDLTSGLHAIRRAPGGWEGAADPRREGIARGR